MTKIRKHKTNKQSPTWRKLDMLILYMHTQADMLDPAFLKRTESTFYPIDKPPKKREDRMETPADRALRLARIINTQDEYIRTYTALMIAYNRHHKADKALDFGRLAWELIGEGRAEITDDDRGLIAYEMAIAYRINRDLEQAKVWLLRASQLLVMTDDDDQYIKVAHETAVIYYLTEEYDVAEQWGLLAIAEGIDLDNPVRTALSRQLTGMAQFKLQKYTACIFQQAQASSIFEQAQDTLNEVISLSYIAESYTILQDPNAIDVINNLSDLLESLKNDDTRNQYEQRVSQLRQIVKQQSPSP